MQFFLTYRLVFLGIQIFANTIIIVKKSSSNIWRKPLLIPVVVENLHHTEDGLVNIKFYYL